MAMTEQSNRYAFRNRYVFKGRLVMSSAFHIGGGKATLSPSDSPVVLTPEGIPFIPGSSFKGAFRSTVEKLVPNLPGDFYSCGLVDLSKKEIEAALERHERVCSTTRQQHFVGMRRQYPDESEAILEAELTGLCDTCRLFGSPFAASHININDLYMPVNEQSDIIERRDGVAIDRDSEKAKDRLKYDFEVVPSNTAFNLEITLENATKRDIQFTCVGLSEFVQGFGGIGGKRSRGLGACRLENLEVSILELSGPGVDEQVRKERLRNYLIKRVFPTHFSGEECQRFLNQQIESIF